jgi:surfactin synthase thioesterase subunit
MYETFKRVIKEDFRDEFSRVESNTLLFWGEDDRATSLQSGETIHQLIGGSKLFPLHGDHFFFIHHTQFISGEIQKRVSS